MRRVLIIGASGAGKSTLAVRLGKILGLPVIHLDAEHWMPNWVAPPQEEWRPKVEKLCRLDSWIMDGNFSGSLDIRIPASDTVIFMDYPRPVYIWRVLKRVWKLRNQTRPDMAPGCPERFDREFMVWLWHFARNTRPSILDKIRANGKGKKVVILHNQSDTDRYLASIGG